MTNERLDILNIMEFSLRTFVFCFMLFNWSNCFSFDDEKCDQELIQFDAALENRELWAQKCKLKFFFSGADEVNFNLVFDTWAKIPSGLLHGNLQTPGHFTECVKFRHETIQGQHCMTSLQAQSNETASTGRFEWRNVGSLVRENNLKLVLGLCLPASCSPKKVIEYSNAVFSDASLEAFSTTCRTNNPVAFTSIDYFAMSE